jgi:hypothetical protein
VAAHFNGMKERLSKEGWDPELFGLNCIRQFPRLIEWVNPAQPKPKSSATEGA